MTAEELKSLIEKAIEREKKEEIETLKIYQTKGGLYNSFPNATHVAECLGFVDSDTYDPNRYNSRGHGEYTSNVDSAVRYCHVHGITTLTGVETVLQEAELIEH